MYDIRVATEDPIRRKIMAMTQNPEFATALRQIGQLDDALAVIVQAIQHSKAKHTFYRSMAKDPVNFIQRWMSSQKRDLEVIMGEATRGGGEDGSGLEFQRGGSKGMWDSPVSTSMSLLSLVLHLTNITFQVVKEAVRYMLAKEHRTT